MLKQDDEILTLLDQEPKQAFELVIEQYTALLWKVAAEHLTNPDDIRDCVNDTFTEFWQKRKHYDKSKGALANYLAGITKNRAISLYRKNRIRMFSELPYEAADNNNKIEELEMHLDLEKAIASLKPDEADIIRMKYYGGMTVQEIAGSLNLPYETVKKRHQRSLGKMKWMLMIALILAFLALLTACVYTVFRYFGVVPGYGVNTEKGVHVYLLKESSLEENFVCLASIIDAVYINGSLFVKLEYEYKEEVPEKYRFGIQLFSLNNEFGTCLYYRTEDGLMKIQNSSGLVRINSEQTYLTVTFTDIELLSAEKEIMLQLAWGDMIFSFSMTEVDESEPQQYSYLLTNQGGLAAIPRLEDGELIVGIYPLNTGEKDISTYLIFSEYMTGQKGDITVQTQNGDILTGEMCMTMTRLFTEWNFGPANPGEYTLHIPYLYFNTTLAEDTIIDVDLEHNTWEDKIYEIPNGYLSITGIKTPELTPGTTYADTVISEKQEYRLIYLHLEPMEDWIPFPAALSCYIRNPNHPLDTELSCSCLWGGDPYNLEYLVSFPKETDGLSNCYLSMKKDKQTSVCWLHSFDMTLTVPEETVKAELADRAKE